MEIEAAGQDSISLSLNLIGLSACVAAVLSTGGLAIIAGAGALACLVGSITASQRASESPCERFWRECDAAPEIAGADDSAISQRQEVGQSYHWRRTVDNSRMACRRR